MDEDDPQGTFTDLHLICRICIEPSKSVIAARSYKEASSAQDQLASKDSSAGAHFENAHL
jgi:hypothetical protein